MCLRVRCLQIPDEEALIKLENRLKIECKRANELVLYNAANLYIQWNNFEEARQLMDTIFRLNPASPKGYLIKGWLELQEQKYTIAANCFRNVLSQVSIDHLCHFASWVLFAVTGYLA